MDIKYDFESIEDAKKDYNVLPMRYRNNWERHEYHVDSGKVVQGKFAEVLVEDAESGRCNIEDVFARMDTRSYDDCGRTYTARSNRYYMFVDVYGKTIEMPLDTIIKQGVKVYFIGKKKQ